MVLVLKNQQIEGLVPMAEAIEVIEQAFRELGQGIAKTAPRARLRVPWKDGVQYFFNNIMGLVPGMKSMALRIDSSFSKEVEVAGSRRRIYPGDYVGLVFLFDMDTCNLLAIMDDHVISTMRVGATSGVATKYLARKDAKVMGLLGSGEQARTQLTAALAVRPLKKIKVYSPTRQNRERFSRQMGAQCGVEIAPVASAAEAVRGSDIVTAATNTVEPVIEGRWLEAGAHVNSIVGGDGYWFLSDKREWVVNGKLAVSRISGSTAAITRAQRASQRYYQRPDASHVSLDPNRKALAGFAGRTNLNRNSGLWQVNASLWGVSPGFESNDLGFMGTSDRAGGHVVFLRRYVTPDRFTRSKTWWVAKSWTWNFNQQMQSDAVQGQASFTFLNYWYFNGGGNWFARTQDDRQTRGGPSMVSPSGNFWNLNGGTDSRRWLSLQGYVSGFSNEAGSWNRNVGMTVNLKPSPMLTISTGPQLTRSLTIAQYVRTVADATAVDTYGERDVFGSLDQTQLSMTTRVNAILTPNS